MSNGIAGAAVRATHAQTPDGAFLAASLPRRRRLGVRALGWLTVTGRALRDGFEAAGSARIVRWHLPGRVTFCLDRKSTRLNSSHRSVSRMPSSA